MAQISRPSKLGSWQTSNRVDLFWLLPDMINRPPCWILVSRLTPASLNNYLLRKLALVHHILLFQPFRLFVCLFVCLFAHHHTVVRIIVEMFESDYGVFCFLLSRYFGIVQEAVFIELISVRALKFARAETMIYIFIYML